MDILTLLLFLAAAASLGIFADALSAQASLSVVIGIGVTAIVYGGFRLMLLFADRTKAAPNRVSIIVVLYVLVNIASIAILIPVLRPDVSSTMLALAFIPVAVLILVQLRRWKRLQVRPHNANA